MSSTCWDCNAAKSPSKVQPDADSWQRARALDAILVATFGHNSRRAVSRMLEGLKGGLDVGNRRVSKPLSTSRPDTES